jgi:hypothetical protein
MFGYFRGSIVPFSPADEEASQDVNRDADRKQEQSKHDELYD